LTRIVANFAQYFALNQWPLVGIYWQFKRSFAVRFGIDLLDAANQIKAGLPAAYGTDALGQKHKMGLHLYGLTDQILTSIVLHIERNRGVITKSIMCPVSDKSGTIILALLTG
jgi:hypothetical protein